MSINQYSSTAVLEDEKLATPDEFSKTDRAKNMLRSNPVKIIAGLVVLAIALVVGGKFLLSAYLHEGTDDAQIDGHIMPLSSRINGQVMEVRVQQGQYVHAGDILAVIDPADYNIAVAQAQARLEDAEASAASSHFNVPITFATAGGVLDSAKVGVINADAGIKAAERNLESAQAALEEAEANAAKSDADLVRYKALVAKEDISRQQYDQAVAAAKANRAAVASAKAGALAAEQNVRQAQGRQLQAQRENSTGTGFHHPCQGGIGRCPGARACRGTRPGPTQPELYGGAFSRHRHRRKEVGGIAAERKRGPGIVLGDSPG
jgi:multidrug resistance efflux pump